MPNRGDASTIVPRIIDNIPTPIRKNLAHPECFPIIPSTILAHPLKRSARPTRMVMTNAVHSGKAIVNPANMSTSIPSPTVAHLTLIGRKIPVMIFSIPTINKIIPSTNTTTRNVSAGNCNA